MSEKPDDAIKGRQKIRPPEMDLEPIPDPTDVAGEGEDEKVEGMPDSDLTDNGTATPPYMKRN